jgi:hypothetical protein
MPLVTRRVLSAVLVVVVGLSWGEIFARGNGRGSNGRGGGSQPGTGNGPAAGTAPRGRAAGSNVGPAPSRLGLPPSVGPFNDRRWNVGPLAPPGAYGGYQAPRTAASLPPGNRAPVPTNPVTARSAPPPPAATSAANRPTPAAPTPTPATYRESAAAHLYALANAAAWNMYEHYTAAPTYASTYREMHRLLLALKALATDVRGTKPGSTADQTLAARLREAEWRLVAIQAEVAAWPSEGAARSTDRDLRTQLERLRGTLTGLLADFGASPEAPSTIADDGEGETIRSRRPADEGPRLAPTPLDDAPPQ